MAEPIKFEKPEINLFATDENPLTAPSSDTPFRVAVFGDFAGRASRGASAALKFKPVEIDRDNFDDLLRKLGVELRLRLGGDGGALALRFDSLEDFHPDRLYERVELFRTLRETRARLGDPKTFKEAAAEVRRWAATSTDKSADSRGGAAQAASAPAESPASSTSSGMAGSSDLIAQMLAGSQNVASGTGRDASPRTGDAGLDSLVREIVGPHLASVDEGEQSELTGAVDEAITRLMRAILHSPDFRTLEASWRALNFLVSRAETGPQLKIYLVELTREELAADVRVTDEARPGELHKLLVEQAAGTRGGEPWSLVVGDYTFAPTWDDAELLLGVADVARQAGAPFVAGADARTIGCDSISETPDPDDWRGEIGEGEDAEGWAALRAHAVARSLGLALPRFLLRLPYGSQTEPTERFDFEEFDDGVEPRHEDYLWGNAAYACALLLCEAFGHDGWEMRAGDPNEIDDLPLHVYEAGGESHVKPCAEVVLSDRAAEEILARGVMPLLSQRGGASVVLARFQSLADPPARLAARWS